MSNLRFLDKSISNVIRHQQIVLNVTSVVKELIENSIDAGSTHIDICLKNYGLDSIEVSDNGSGVHEDDLQNFAQKNYTSKLTSIEDLGHLSTFGFRGEAINSLCSMGSLRCITRHLSSDQAIDIIYDKQGAIQNRVYTARDVGTTVIVGELFGGVPVRRRELEKNIKSDYSKVLRLLEAFSIFNSNCSFFCCNWVKNNKTKGTLQKLSVLNVQKSDCLWDRMKDIFGEQQLVDLSRIEHRENLVVEDQSPNSNSNSSRSTSQQLDNSQAIVSFHGYISNVNGKSSKFHKNSQYLYINNRWCSQSKFIKVINQVYQQCSCSSRLPFLVLFINLPDGMVDVNVSTQKDVFIVKKERQFLVSLKKYIEHLLGTQQSIESSKLNLTLTNVSDISAKYFQPKVAKLDNSLINENNEITSQSNNKVLSNIEVFPPLLSQDNESSLTFDPKLVLSSSLEGIEKCVIKSKNKRDSYITSTTTFEDALIERKRYAKEIMFESNEFEQFCTHNLHIDFNDFDISTRDNDYDSLNTPNSLPTDCEAVTNACTTSNANIHNEIFTKKFHRDWFEQMNIIGQFNHGFIIAEYGQALYVIDQHAADEKFNYERMKANLKINSQRLLKPMPLKLTPFQFNQLLLYKSHLSKIGLEFQMDEDNRVARICAIPFINGSFLFNDNEVVELLEQFSQSMYNIGIFSSDTTDDEMSQSNNNTIRDKIVDGSTLYSKKINHIIATKACRSSIMIGKPLTHKIMRNIINNLATLKQPWNCPHGRPTMRHLLNL